MANLLVYERFNSGFLTRNYSETQGTIIPTVRGFFPLPPLWGKILS